jgi:hypothetical protein
MMEYCEIKDDKCLYKLCKYKNQRLCIPIRYIAGKDKSVLVKLFDQNLLSQQL